MSDAIGLAEALLGFSGFRVLEVTESPDEPVVIVETTSGVVGCGECGTRAVTHERQPRRLQRSLDRAPPVDDG